MNKLIRFSKKNPAIVLIGLLILSIAYGCGEGGMESPFKAKSEKKELSDSQKESLELLKKIHVPDTQVPLEILKAGTAGVIELAAYGEKTAAEWERTARFPDSIMPSQNGKSAIYKPYKAILEKTKAAAGKEVDASLALGHFLILGREMSLKLIFSKKVAYDGQPEAVSIVRLKYKEKDTLAFKHTFKGTKYESRGEAWLLIYL